MQVTKQAPNDCLPGLATRIGRVKAPMNGHSIVNYVKAGGPIVLKFEVFLHAVKRRQALII
jgi:hypothetical protein